MNLPVQAFNDDHEQYAVVNCLPPIRGGAPTSDEHAEAMNATHTAIDVHAARDAAELMDGDSDAFPAGAADAIRQLLGLEMAVNQLFQEAEAKAAGVDVSSETWAALRDAAGL